MTIEYLNSIPPYLDYNEYALETGIKDIEYLNSKTNVIALFKDDDLPLAVAGIIKDKSIFKEDYLWILFTNDGTALKYVKQYKKTFKEYFLNENRLKTYIEYGNDITTRFARFIGFYPRSKPFMMNGTMYQMYRKK